MSKAAVYSQTSFIRNKGISEVVFKVCSVSYNFFFSIETSYRYFKSYFKQH